ncbi:hypothetical protein E8E14_008291 [Neopestalotiopsis sp. 37M]|nr:hypothetical protein E8E14_008291 [Neopestalotiopsis sp. 37M]
MGNVGRFFCVALPFILTTASIICMLIVGLTGVTGSSSLYIFEANVTDLSISSSLVTSLLSRDLHELEARQGDSSSSWHDASSLASSTASSASSSASAAAASAISSALGGSSTSTNITATDLGLDDLYNVNLWGYCSIDADGNRDCTKAKFNWAESTFNDSYLSASGYNITLPDEISDALTAFKTVTKWTEVVYIITMIALGLELVLGFFTYCSRAVSCVTYLVSGIATTAVCATAGMITALAVIVVGAIEGTAKAYGVTGTINTNMLAAAWLGAAFAIAASMFWLFSACCCKRDPKQRHSKHGDEKPFLSTGAYAPIHDHQNNNHGYNQQAWAPRGNNARSDLAYEPYSHSHSNHV